MLAIPGYLTINAITGPTAMKPTLITLAILLLGFAIIGAGRTTYEVNKQLPAAEMDSIKFWKKILMAALLLGV
ncbi:hypothetical protein SDC9_208491 [bioreactor metagenome]|uniref:Uncharacterized protein n=1 Tax=bioreactor metagenome TaxID=1076179 RepID=A0A645JDK8_9ZZZZ